MFDTSQGLREVLYEGFEAGVVGWETVDTLAGLLCGDEPVVLTGVTRWGDNAWVWLNNTRFFVSYPGSPAPPLKSVLVSVEPRGASVTFRFRKRNKEFLWTGDAVRCSTPDPL